MEPNKDQNQLKEQDQFEQSNAGGSWSVNSNPDPKKDWTAALVIIVSAIAIAAIILLTT